MDDTPASDTLHRLVAEAVQRGAEAQRQSRLLVADHREIDAALRETLARIEARRRAAAERQPPTHRC
jgi:hypothetical protein